MARKRKVGRPRLSATRITTTSVKVANSRGRKPNPEVKRRKLLAEQVAKYKKRLQAAEQKEFIKAWTQLTKAYHKKQKAKQKALTLAEQKFEKAYNKKLAAKAKQEAKKMAKRLRKAKVSKKSAYSKQVLNQNSSSTLVNDLLLTGLVQNRTKFKGFEIV